MGHFDNFFGDGCEANAIYQKHRVFLQFAEYAATLMGDVVRDVRRTAELSDDARARLRIRLEHLATTLRNEPPGGSHSDEPLLLPVYGSISVVHWLLEESLNNRPQYLTPTDDAHKEFVSEVDSSVFIIQAYAGTVKRLVGIASSNELDSSLPDEFVSQPIPDTAQAALKSMFELGAFTHNPIPSETICSHAIIGSAKKTFKLLSEEQLVEGRRGIGYWLTARGRRLALWYAAHAKTNFEGTI